MGGKPAWVGPPQADIQNVPLAKAPAVAFHIGAEIQLGRFLANAAARPLASIHFKLRFLGNNCRFRGLPFRNLARDGTKMPAGANDYSASDLIVDSPSIAGTI